LIGPPPPASGPAAFDAKVNWCRRTPPARDRPQRQRDRARFALRGAGVSADTLRRQDAIVQLSLSAVSCSVSRRSPRLRAGRGCLLRAAEVATDPTQLAAMRGPAETGVASHASPPSRVGDRNVEEAAVPGEGRRR
jgi:hypothetical protein